MQSAASTRRTRGTHSSSRVVGRSTTAVPALPGAGEATGVLPRASMAAAEPGAMVDSPTSNRSTANRTGAAGSTASAELPGPTEDDGTPDAAAEAAPEADAAGSRIGVTV